MNTQSQIIEFNNSIIPELNQLNKPLLQNFGIYLFTYRRLNKNGSLLHLTTQKDWIEHSIQNQLLVSSEIVPKIMQTMDTSKQHYLWSGNLKDPLYHSLHNFNIWNGITFYQNYEDYIEIIAFASSPHNESASNFYINNLGLLDHFKAFFKEKTKHILSSDSLKKLSMNVEEKIPIFGQDEITRKNHMNFIKETKLSRFYFTSPYEHIYLTPKEAQVLFYLSQGKTCKEIARILSKFNQEKDCHLTSERTIECHWNSIKLKFDLEDRNKIIDIFINSNIPSLMTYYLKVFN